MVESSNKQNIEDVLSSIRRLVSTEDVRTPLASGARPEKLLLTPQLRVTDPEDPYQTIRALTQAVAPLDYLEEDSLEDAPDADVLMAAFSEDGTAKAAEPMDPALEQAFAAPLDGAAPEMTVPEVPEPVDVEDIQVTADSEDMAPLRLDNPIAVETPPRGAVFDESAMDEPFDKAKLQTVSPEQDSPPEDEVPTDDGAETDEAPMAPQGEPLAAAPPAIPFPHNKVQRVAEPTATPAPEADDVLDEETLREIIAEVVREEFAGQLGERITRNVRKLVRREIRQILSSEDLD